MTKFILHGGKTRIVSESNKNYYREIVKDLANPIILLCYFSRPKNEWPELFKNDKNCFSNYTNRDDFKFVLADENGFEKQIKSADILYMRGGDTEKLKQALLKFKNFGGLIRDKVVVGSSAGFYVLSKYYYSKEGYVEKGLGILPIKAIAHYNSSQNYDAIKKYSEDLEIVALPETEYVVRNKIIY